MAGGWPTTGVWWPDRWPWIKTAERRHRWTNGAKRRRRKKKKRKEVDGNETEKEELITTKMRRQNIYIVKKEKRGTCATISTTGGHATKFQKLDGRV